MHKFVSLMEMLAVKNLATQKWQHILIGSWFTKLSIHLFTWSAPTLIYMYGHALYSLGPVHALRLRLWTALNLNEKTSSTFPCQSHLHLVIWQTLVFKLTKVQLSYSLLLVHSHSHNAPWASLWKCAARYSAGRRPWQTKNMLEQEQLRHLTVSQENAVAKRVSGMICCSTWLRGHMYPTVCSLLVWVSKRIIKKGQQSMNIYSELSVLQTCSRNNKSGQTKSR